MDKNILQQAVDTWGESTQVDMCIEEMSELTKALLKYRRLDEISRNGAVGSGRKAHIREEIADVQIMINQMRLIYGDTSDDEQFKIDRLAERLKHFTEQ